MTRPPTLTALAATIAPFRLTAVLAVLTVVAAPTLAQTDAAGPADPRLAAIEQAAADVGADAATGRSLAQAALAAISEDQKLVPAPATVPTPGADDSFGWSVAVSGSTAIVGAYHDDSGGADAGAAYVLKRTEGAWIQVSKLTASDAAVGDQFGISVAVSGSTAVVGAHQDGDGGASSGSAYAFDLAACGAACTEASKLTASDAAAGDSFGFSVSVSGSTAVVGAYGNGSSSGSAYAFDLGSCGAACTEASKLTASDAAAYDHFGYSVAVSGSTAVVGAFQDVAGGNVSGSAYAFDLGSCGAACTEASKLTASDAAGDDFLGWSVAVSGSTAVVGAPRSGINGSASGSAYAFDLGSCGAACTEASKLTASDAAGGDRFGTSVAVSGSTAVVGAYREDDGGADSGSAYAFDLGACGAACTQALNLTAPDAAAGDYFGYSVAVSGSTAVVGAYGDDDGGADSGSAYAFGLDSCWLSACSEVSKLTASDAAADDRFGTSVSVSGSTAVVGAYQAAAGGANSGSAYVLERSGGTWVQVSKLTASDAAADDRFGWSVAVSGSTVVVGAYQDGDGGSSSGSAYAFDLSACGAACFEASKLTASDAAAYGYFGFSVAVSGSTAVVGAYGGNGIGNGLGSAYAFDLSACGAACTETSKLKVSDAAAYGYFGFSVAVSGSTAVVGALLGAVSQSGSAYAFDLSACGAACFETSKLTASDAAASDYFGHSVAVSGSTAVVGAPQADDGGFNSGSAYAFDLGSCGAACTETSKLTASDAAADDFFGSSVAVSESTAVVGASGSGSYSGSAYAFDLGACGAACTESSKLTASDADAGDRFGASVAASGLTTVVGAYGDDDGGSNSGSVYAFTIPLLAVTSVSLDGAEGWRALASPEPTTVGAFLDGLWTQGFPGADNPDGECTVFTFAEGAATFIDGWACVGDASDPLARGEGVLVFVYADDPSTSVVEGFPKTLSAPSAVQPTGDFAFSLAFTDDGRAVAQKGWNLLGSPFGTSLDWDAVTRSGVTPTVHVYDPAFGDTGGFRTYTSEGGVGHGELADGLVPPFQAFFAKAYAPSPSLVLPRDGGTADGGDVYGRHAVGEPPLPPPAPAQSVSLATDAAGGPDAVTALGTVAPNPTTGGATVSWTLAEAREARVSVVDMLGREVAVLASGARAAGPHRSAVPAGLAPGVYVVRLQAGSASPSVRFTVVR